MEEYITNKFTDYLAEKSCYKKESNEYQLILYGVKALYTNISKTIVLMIISAFLGILKHIIFLMFIYGLIRSFAFGIHLKSSNLCTVIGIIYYLGGYKIAESISLEIPVLIVIYILLFLIYLIYAPSETVNRPISKRENKKFKRKTLIVFAVLFLSDVLISLKFRNHLILSNLITIALVMEAINILPITYKIFREERKVQNEKI